MSKLECLMNIHWMDECLDLIIVERMEYKPTPVQQYQMESLDCQMFELQKCTEQRCYKILKPDI